MVTVTAVLGHVDDPAFSGRVRDPLVLTAAEAAQGRVRRRSEAGTELALALPRGTFLQVGDVLQDDGHRIVAVGRRPEPALVITVPADPADALALGYFLGNQHSPVDRDGDEVRVPLLTGAEAALDAARRLGLTAQVRDVALAAHGWWRGAGGHA